MFPQYDIVFHQYDIEFHQYNIVFHQSLVFRSIRGDFSMMIHPSSVLFKEAPPQW